MSSSAPASPISRRVRSLWRSVSHCSRADRVAVERAGDRLAVDEIDLTLFHQASCSWLAGCKIARRSATSSCATLLALALLFTTGLV
jgi:hypothetical protein